MLNRLDTQNWTAKEIVEFIQNGKDGISFSKYARKHIEKMISRGQEKTLLTDETPRPVKVQVKITNLDKQQIQLYQRVLK